MHQRQGVSGGMAPSRVAAKLGSSQRRMSRHSRQASRFIVNPFFTHFFAVSAKGLYDYPGGSADELPFSEGDIISVVDRSDRDWYKAEKDGVIFIVPAAYLEIEG